MTTRASSPPIATGEATSRPIPETLASTISTRLFMAVLVVAILNSVLTGSMVNVVLSEIRGTFDVSTAQLSWVITAYSLMYAIGIPLFGRISDFIGTRTLFLAGIAGFALGGLIVAIAPSFAVVIIGRFIQGAGGAAVPALSMVMIARVMPPEKRGGAMGLTASAVGIGSAIGPLVGGSIGDSVGWRFLFIVPVLVSVGIMILAPRALPNTRITDDRQLDVLGGALLAASIGLFLFGITQGQASGYGSILPVMAFLGAVLATTLFVYRTNSAQRPFVPPSLFRNRPYVRLMAMASFNMMAYLSSLVLVPLMLVEHNGMTPTEAGLVLTPGAIAIAVGSRIAGTVSDRIGPRIPITAGLSTMLVAAVYLSTIGAGADAWVVAIGVLVSGAGTSMITAPMNSHASRLLSAEETGIGMGLFSGAAFMGGGIGAAVTGAWLNARQDANTGALNPFFTGEANAWSDAFLAVVAMLIVALLIVVPMRLQART